MRAFSACLRTCSTCCETLGVRCKIVTLIKGFNAVLSREYKDENNNPISIDLANDTEETIRKKVAVVKDPSKMLKSLTKTLGGT